MQIHKSFSRVTNNKWNIWIIGYYFVTKCQISVLACCLSVKHMMLWVSKTCNILMEIFIFFVVVVFGFCFLSPLCRPSLQMFLTSAPILS